MALSVPWWLALGLSAMVSANANTTTGLVLEPPWTSHSGRLQLPVGRLQSPGLGSSDRAHVAVLATRNLALPLGQWRTLEQLPDLDDSQLLFHFDAGSPPSAPWFFVARESPATTLVKVNSAASLRAAVAAAKPGTRILLAPGTYPGGFQFSQVQGAPGQPIVIGAEDPTQPPVLQGGANGIQLSDPAYVELQDLVITGATGNGLNIDDAGTFDTPAHHIVLRRLRITDIGPSGNRDGIKLSGVIDFTVEHCTLERWGNGGSGIDMVGCHRGRITHNLLRHTPESAATGANGIQTKGGSREVVIRHNRFEHVGARSVNVGGSTGLAFFRPPHVPEQENWEARDIHVEGNTFIGSTAPIAFVGVHQAVVRFNTFYRPGRWAIRILQENNEPGFVPSRLGHFTENLIVFHSTEWASGGVNIGAHTAPETFSFARNAWFCVDDPARSRPTLPTPESNGTYGQDPRFRDPQAGDLRLQPDSPLRHLGADALP